MEILFILSHSLQYSKTTYAFYHKHFLSLCLLHKRYKRHNIELINHPLTSFLLRMDKCVNIELLQSSCLFLVLVWRLIWSFFFLCSTTTKENVNCVYKHKASRFKKRSISWRGIRGKGRICNATWFYMTVRQTKDYKQFWYEVWHLE